MKFLNGKRLEKKQKNQQTINRTKEPSANTQQPQENLSNC
jgi:hypothetical protein